VFALSIALPLRTRLATYFDNHPHAAALAGEPDAFDRAAGWVAGPDWSLLADIRRRESSFFEALSLALVWIGIAAWLFGQAVAGGLLAAADEDDRALAGAQTAGGSAGEPARLSAARFLAGAGHWFFPML